MNRMYVVVRVVGGVQFLIACNIPFSLFVMVAIAVDRYLCICHPFTRLLTYRRAKLTAIALALGATTVGLCVALMYGVHTQFPLDALMAAAAAAAAAAMNRTLQAGYDVTPITGNDDDEGEELASCGGGNCSSLDSVVELNEVPPAGCRRSRCVSCSWLIAVFCEYVLSVDRCSTDVSGCSSCTALCFLDCTVSVRGLFSVFMLHCDDVGHQLGERRRVEFGEHRSLSRE